MESGKTRGREIISRLLGIVKAQVRKANLFRTVDVGKKYLGGRKKKMVAEALRIQGKREPPNTSAPVRGLGGGATRQRGPPAAEGERGPPSRQGSKG